MATPHNEAEPGSVARTVLMPGDPLRAKFIAQTYLQDPVLFNTVRNMFGYTGTYHGVRVSVMGSGMGMPSIGIYSYELYKFYDVENIIRIGSAGSYCHELEVMDIALVESAWSETTYAKVQSSDDADLQYPSDSLNAVIRAAARKTGQKVISCRVHSSDVFYHEENVPNYRNFYKEHQCCCVDMESFALFHNARITGKKAACLLTISDSFVSDIELNAKEREISFHGMMQVALEAAAAIG